MEKRYICFTCHKFHPEMRGVSEEEFNSGSNVCKEEKCSRKGEFLEPAFYCDICYKMFNFEQEHRH